MKFKYTARDSTGKQIKGVVESSTAANAANLVKDQRLVPITIKEITPGLSLSSLNSAMGNVSLNDLANFTRQLATMITAGLPLTDALNLLSVQSSQPLAGIVAAMLNDVQAGISLSSAMAKHPTVFSKVYVSLVKAGEAAGVMENILNRLADTSERSREFRSKVSGAMIYPMIIVIGMVAVFAMMIVLVVPKLTALYKDFNADLPIATRAMIAISDFSLNYWWAVIAIAGGLGFLAKTYASSKTGRATLDDLSYKIPVWGPLAKQVMMTEITRTLSLLIGAGVSVVEALNIVADAAGNVMVEKDLRRISKQVEKGFPISISFSDSPVFLPVVGQMIAVGEETGKLDDVLAKVSHYFESESEQKVKGLTSAIEPIILIVLAVGVGFLMYAIIMPMYQITNQI